MVPPVPGVLDGLVTVQHEVANDDTQGCHVVRRVRRLRAIDKAAFARVAEVVGEPLSIPDNETMAGYEPVLRALLEEKGFDVRSTPRLPQLPEPDLGAVLQRGKVDSHLLHGLRQHERLLVRHGPTVNVAWLVAQIGLAYPFVSIVLAVASNGEARHFGEQIRRWVPDEVSVVTSDRPEPQSTQRIVVATHICLGCGSIGTAKRDLYIDANAIKSLGRKGRMGLDEAWRARLVGMLPAEEQVAQRDEDELRGFYGFDEVSIPAHGHHVLPVDVVIIPMNGRCKLTHDASPADVKRQAVWRHAGRNARIATLASRLADGDLVGLRRSFAQVAAALGDAGPQRVGLLVDNVEHGVLLARQLDGWALATASQVDLRRLSPTDQRMLDAEGPAFEGKPEKPLVYRILGVATAAGFREISPGTVKRALQAAQDRWTAYKARANQGEGQQGEEVAAAHPLAADATGQLDLPEAGAVGVYRYGHGQLGCLGPELAEEYFYFWRRGYRYEAAVAQVTGSTPGKPTYGLNIMLFRVVPELPREEADAIIREYSRSAARLQYQ